jgi:DNA repair protein RecN (Recombination protein N)
MLRGLTIRDMLLIDRLDITFHSGLNVLTGETGAGKSILLDSLGFVLGWRGRAELVREGAERGEVVAEFDLPNDHPAHAVIAEAGLEDDGALLLRRVNSRDGRKQAFVNDRRCAGETLRRISETLVELHGQHDDRGLLNARGHKALLDGFAGHEARLEKIRKSWRGWRNAREALAMREARLAEISTDRDFLEHAVGEIAELAPEVGEDAKLDGERRLMQAAERIRKDIEHAAKALGLDGAEGSLGDATRWLDGVETQAEGRLSAPIAAIARALEELGTAQQGVESCQAALDFNPHELEAVEERLFAIRALARKHGIQSDELPALAITLQSRLTEIEDGEGDLGDLKAAVNHAAVAYDKLASELTKARQAAAQQLDKSMAVELAPLKMERAVFTTEIKNSEAGPDGQDGVQFTVATNPGAPSGALDKIASGGELSRFMLALKVCLHGDVAGVTMIFDEIDRGVGGATADAVGRRLAALADGGQVLVVTHSPQVAALGAHHFKVLKTVNGEVTRSDVLPVTGTARVDEVARMLAGDRLTDEARAAAEVLLRAGT